VLRGVRVVVVGKISNHQFNMHFFYITLHFSKSSILTAVSCQVLKI